MMLTYMALCREFGLSYLLSQRNNFRYFFGRAGLDEGRGAGYFLAGTYSTNAACPEMLQRGPSGGAPTLNDLRNIWAASSPKPAIRTQPFRGRFHETMPRRRSRLRTP